VQASRSLIDFHVFVILDEVEQIVCLSMSILGG
jgi:hypothetical protein